MCRWVLNPPPLIFSIIKACSEVRLQCLDAEPAWTHRCQEGFQLYWLNWALCPLLQAKCASEAGDGHSSSWAALKNHFLRLRCFASFTNGFILQLTEVQQSRCLHNAVVWQKNFLNNQHNWSDETCLEAYGSPISTCLTETWSFRLAQCLLVQVLYFLALLAS